MRGATIINMIGYTGPDPDLLHDTNVRFVERLLTRAAQAGVAHVVLASSAAAYGSGTGAVLSEADTLNPVTPYGRSKAAMEQAVATFAASHQAPNITVLRIGNVAGADALTDAARRNAVDGNPMTLHRLDDGTAPVRSYIGPRDLFDAVSDVIAAPTRPLRTINVVHPQPVTLDAMLRGYRDHVFPTLDWADAPAPAGTFPSITLATDQIQLITKFANYDDPASAFTAQVADWINT